MIIQLNVEAALLYKLFLGIAYICSVGYPPLPYLKNDNIPGFPTPTLPYRHGYRIQMIPGIRHRTLAWIIRKSGTA